MNNVYYLQNDPRYKIKKRTVKRVGFKSILESYYKFVKKYGGYSPVEPAQEQYKKPLLKLVK